MSVQATVLKLLEQRGRLHGWMTAEGRFIDVEGTHGDAIRRRYAQRMGVDPKALSDQVNMIQWQKAGLNPADFKTTEGWVRYAIQNDWVRLLDLIGIEGRTRAIVELLGPIKSFYEHFYSPDQIPDDPFVMRTYASGEMLGTRHDATINYHEFLRFKNVKDLERAGAVLVSPT